MAAATLYPALVRNRAKLAYPSVGAWLEGRDRAAAARVGARPRAEPPPAERRRRGAQGVASSAGALTLDTVEGRAVFAGDEVRDIAAMDRSRASELIEDFMIAANTSTAQFLESRGFSSVRRVVRMPERWPRIVTLAAGTGKTLPATPDAKALEQWLLERRERDPERFDDLSLSVVKLLGRGTYVVEPPNEPTRDHFGLAVDDYAHTTAPNRRFADMVTQRLVKAALAGQPSPYGDEELTAIAARCTEREDAANRVERLVRKRPPPCCSNAGAARSSTVSSRVRRPRAPGSGFATLSSKGGSSAGRKASRLAIMCASGS